VHAGHVRRRDRNVGIGDGMDHVRADAQPGGDEEAAGADPGGVPGENDGDGGRPACEQPPVPEAGRPCRPPGLGVRRRSPLMLCATPFVPLAAPTNLACY
jgi:hypothetical protein